MSVPVSVQKVLDKQNISYSVAIESASTSSAALYQNDLKSSGVARSVILSDAEGRVQLLVPSDALLDVNAVNRALQRNLRALGATELRSFYDKHQLQSVPALPRLAGMHTLIDQRLLNSQRVLLDSGSGDVLQLAQRDFAALAEKSHACELAVPLAELERQVGDVAGDEEDIREAVKSFTTLRVQQRLEETLELPPLPETAQRIIKLRVDPAADISDLADIVELDPSLSAQVVSWAASPYYSAPGKIKSIHDAIVRVLGFDMVLNLALGLALGKTLSVPSEAPRGATPYWHQAVYTAATVEGLVTAIPREHRPGFGLAYLSGLLHNFGWLILAEVFPPHFSSISRCIEANPHLPPQYADLHVLGVTRDQLASWLMGNWNMPEEVVTALRLQSVENMPANDHAPYARLLMVAQRLLQQRGIGQGPQLPVPERLYEELHLKPESAQQALDTIFESSDEILGIARQLAS